MAEIFNYKEHDGRQQDFVGWAFIAALTSIKDEIKVPMNTSAIELEFKINGQEASFLRIIERLKEEFDHMVEKQAVSLLKDKAGDIMGKLCELEQAVQEHAGELIATFNKDR